MANTLNLNLDPKEEGNTSWFTSWLALFGIVDDLGKLFIKTVPLRFDPVSGQLLFDSWIPDENITVFAVAVDASAGAPAGGTLTGALRINGAVQAYTFDLNSGATQQKTVYGSPLNVDAGQRVGSEWAVVPSDPGLPGFIDIYYQVRAIA